MDITEQPVGRIDLAGAQTVRTIHDAHRQLDDALAGHAAVEIALDAVTELDLGLIQLLVAARRSADRAGKSFTLASPATGALRLALDRAGFLAGAADPAAGRTFWLKEHG
jgi:hypothetical protein